MNRHLLGLASSLVFISLAFSQGELFDARRAIDEAAVDLGILSKVKVSESTWKLRSGVSVSCVRISNRQRSGHAWGDILRFARRIEIKDPRFRVVEFDAGLWDLESKVWRPGDDFMFVAATEDMKQGVSVVDILTTLLENEEAFAALGLDRFSLTSERVTLRVKPEGVEFFEKIAKEKLGFRCLRGEATEGRQWLRLISLSGRRSSRERWPDPRPAVEQVVRTFALSEFLSVSEPTYELRHGVVARCVRVSNRDKAGYAFFDLLRIVRRIETKNPGLRILEADLGWRDGDSWRPGSGFLVVGSVADGKRGPSVATTFAILVGLEAELDVVGCDRLSLNPDRVLIRAKPEGIEAFEKVVEERLEFRMKRGRATSQHQELTLTPMATPGYLKIAPDLKLLVEGLALRHGVEGVKRIEIASPAGNAVRLWGETGARWRLSQLIEFASDVERADPRLRVDGIHLRRKDEHWGARNPFLTFSTAMKPAPLVSSLRSFIDLLEVEARSKKESRLEGISFGSDLVELKVQSLDEAKRVGRTLASRSRFWEPAFLVHRYEEPCRLYLSPARAKSGAKGIASPRSMVIEGGESPKGLARIYLDDGALVVEFAGATEAEARQRAEAFGRLSQDRKATLDVVGKGADGGTVVSVTFR